MGRLTQNLILAEYAVKYVESIMSRGTTEYDQSTTPFNRPGPYNRPESVVHRVLSKMPPVPERPEQGPDVAPEQGFGAFMKRAFWDSPWVADQKAKQQARSEWVDQVHANQRPTKDDIKRQRDAQRPSLLNALARGGAPAAAAILCGSLVEQSGLGNCGEQSYVAFKYLVTKGAPGLAIVDWAEVAKPPEGVKAPTGNHTFVVIGMAASVPDVSHGSLIFPPKWGADAVVCDPWYHEWFQVESVNDWQSRMKRILSETLGLRAGALDLAAAKNAGPDRVRGYAQAVSQEWKFKRLAYLPHGTPELTKLACTSGNQLRTLHGMRAVHYRGARL